jgi:hypothetical protein
MLEKSITIVQNSLEEYESLRNQLEASKKELSEKLKKAEVFNLFDS